eukprot:scaffold1247_cov251-Pinguiococcus_pyrenoidosus.AAC.11
MAPAADFGYTERAAGGADPAMNADRLGRVLLTPLKDGLPGGEPVPAGNLWQKCRALLQGSLAKLITTASMGGGQHCRTGAIVFAVRRPG